MASIISSGTTSGTALNFSGDTSGVLQLATNGTTTALSISTAQVVTLTNALPVTSGGTGVTTSTGTGANVLGTSPTIATPTISSLSSASATALTLQSAGTTAITCSTSQQVGIGTTSPARNLHVRGSAVTTLANGNGALFTDASNAGVLLGSDNVLGYISGVTAAGTATVDLVLQPFGGNLLVGTTGISTGSFKGIQCGVNSGGFPNYLSNNPAGTANRNWSFGMNNADQFAVYGYNTTTFNTGAYIAWGGTSWTASSDERKKDIIEPIENGLQKVSTLRAVIGKYKTDEEGTRRSFLIAQDVQAVLPEAVDASNPDDLGVQYTEVIPLLVSAIKELKAINDTQAETINAQSATLVALTARIVALESKA